MDYSYQPRLVAQCQTHLDQEGRVVLAAGCGAGKTRMAIDLIGQHLTSMPGDKVLVLTHGQRELRRNFADALKAARLPYAATVYGGDGKPADPTAAIHVALPHARRAYIDQTYSLIVVDEAHQFYTGNMIQEILAANPGVRQLLLTASHSWYTRNKWPVVYMSQMELLDAGVLESPRIDLIFTTDDVRSGLTADGDVRRTHQLPGVAKAATDCLELLAGEVGQKILVAVHNGTAAKQVAKRLNQAGIRAVLSTAESDGDSREITRFRTDKSVRALVVIYRGILGFDMPELDTVLDLTGSQNIDRLYQLLGRVVRRGVKASAPRYVKMAPAAQDEWYFHVMCGVAALALPEVYSTFNGRLDSLRVPVPQGHAPREIIARGLPQSSLMAQRPEPRLIPSWSVLDAARRAAERGELGYTIHSMANIRAAYSGQDPVGNKQAIMRWSELNGRTPRQAAEDPEERRLGDILHHYCSPSSSAYDGEFHEWAKSAGYGMSRKKVHSQLLIRDWFTQNGRMPSQHAKDSQERALGARLSQYCSQSSSTYDPEFHEWAKSLGYGRDSKKLSQHAIRDWYTATGRLPSGYSRDPEEARLGKCLSRYCSQSQWSYDADFDSWARAVGYGSRNRKSKHKDNTESSIDE